MWSSHSCLKFKPFHMHPWPFRVQCLPSLQLVSSYIPLHNLPSVHEKYICPSQKRPYFFTFAPFDFVSFSLEYHSLPSFSNRSSLTTWGRISCHLLLSLYGTLLFCYSNYQIDDTFLFTDLPPTTDCRLGSGLSLCFIDSAAFRMQEQLQFFRTKLIFMFKKV